MSRHLYLAISGAVFGLVACLHLLRLVLRWRVVVENWTVPLWPGWGAVAGASSLCLWAFHLLRKEI